MVSINNISVQAVRVDKVVGYFSALVEARDIPMSIGTFLSIAMSLGRSFQAVMEGSHNCVCRLDLVELIGPLGIVEVAEYVPGVRVGGLHLHGAFEMTRGGIVACLK